jgi:hypothetical protein
MRVAVVPSPPALLPSYAGLTDPVADLRAAALAAVAWLDGPVQLVAADDLGHRVGRHLLGRSPVDTADNLLVVADGSARRGEKAPGHLDERAFAFDAAIDTALRQGDPAALSGLDEDLGAQLLAAGVPALRQLGRLVGERPVRAQVDYADDPFGVQYWVVRWEVSCDC